MEEYLSHLQQKNKIKILYLIAGISLVVSLISLYGIFALHAKINALSLGTTIKSNERNNGNGETPSQNPPDTNPPTRVDASIDDDPVLGKNDAKVTIIEFSDYQCPFCRKFWTESLPLIRKNYIDTGKAKLVYRDFPLSFHPAAQPAAEAANCAREKGGDTAYFKMHDKIFQEENKIDGGDPNTGPVQSTIQFTSEDLKKWAKDLGYDIGNCLDASKYRIEVQKDFNDGSKYGVSGTPTFFINRQELVGAQPYQAFEQAIESALNALN